AQAIENLEKDARGWYGGAVGMISINGDINTGILIRTIHLKNGIVRYGAGATLLYDSVPALEEEETRMKAATLFRALRAPSRAAAFGWVYRESCKLSAASWESWTIPCTASRPRSPTATSAYSKVCRSGSRSAATTRCSRAVKHFRVALKSPPRRTMA